MTGALNSAGGHAYPGQTIQDATVGMLIPEVSRPIAAPSQQAGSRVDVDTAENLIPEVANPLTHRMHKGINTTADEGQTAIIETRNVAASLTRGADSAGEGSYAGRRREDDENLVAHAEVADPICANEQRTYTHEGAHNFRLRNVVAVAPGPEVASPLTAGMAKSASRMPHEQGDLVPIAFDTTQITHPENRSNPQPDAPSHALAAGAHPPAIAFQPRFARNDRGAPDEIAAPLTAEAGRTGKGDSAQCVAFKPSHYTRGKDGAPNDVAFGLSADADKGDQDQVIAAAGYAVRRLTPRECERLQGFPDDFTLIPYRGGMAADGPRYRALGNSWAVNVARWIGERIELVERTSEELKAAAGAGGRDGGAQEKGRRG